MSFPWCSSFYSIPSKMQKMDHITSYMTFFSVTHCCKDEMQNTITYFFYLTAHFLVLVALP